MKLNISLHPRLAAFIETVLGTILFAWLARVSTVSAIAVWFVLRAALSAVLMRFVFCPPPLPRGKLFVELVFLHIATALLVVILDNPNILILGAAVGQGLATCTYLLLPTTAGQLSFAFKPARRVRLMAGVFTLFGLSSALYASSTLQLTSKPTGAALWVLFFLLILSISVWWWREYALPISRRMALAVGVVGVLVMQLAGFVWWLPIGYLSAGFIVAWWWYGWWLMMRFALTPEGVYWKKHAGHFAFSALLFVCYIIFIVRWR